MSFDWREYEKVAHWIHDNAVASNCAEEACYRTAMSRSYYAAFQCVMDFVVERDSFSKKEGGDDHGGLLAHLKKRGGARARIHLYLDRLRDNRLQADYEKIFEGDPRRQSEVSLANVKTILETLDKMLGAT